MRAKRLGWISATIAAGAMLFAGGMYAVAAEDTDPAVVRTSEGDVRGEVTETSRVFQGIPYAQPPVGEQRWEPPEPVEEWEETRDATEPASACPQLPGDQAGVPSEDEDCLYLNVTTPAEASDESLPVMVFTHGGGNFGAGHQYEASRMAERGEAIVVTVNYRLGAFGYMAHEDSDGPANLGLADQQAALDWVRGNASHFGGDDDNVTLMGESSGGYTTCANLTSPQARGLFDKAIIESAPCTGAEEISLEEAKKQGAELGNQLDCATMECMRHKPVDQILEAQGQQRNAPLIVGDELLPTSIPEAVNSGDFHQVPVLQGINRDEERLMIGGAEAMGQPPIDKDDYPVLLEESFGDNAERVRAEYPLEDFDSPSEALAAAQTDAGYGVEAVESLRAMAEHTTTYGFQFADDDAPWFADYDKPSFPTGAFHMAEMNYLFGMDVFDAKNDAQQRLGDTMIDYWTAFAASGDPNRPDTPQWDEFADREVLALAPGKGGVAPVDFADSHRYEFWSNLAG